MGCCSGKCCLYSVEFAKGDSKGEGEKGGRGGGEGRRGRERLILKFTKCTKQERKRMKKEGGIYLERIKERSFVPRKQRKWLCSLILRSRGTVHVESRLSVSGDSYFPSPSPRA